MTASRPGCIFSRAGEQKSSATGWMPDINRMAQTYVEAMVRPEVIENNCSLRGREVSDDTNGRAPASDSGRLRRAGAAQGRLRRGCGGGHPGPNTRKARRAG